MASTDALPIPRKNIAYRVTFPLYLNSGALLSGATGLDSEESIDAGTFTDLSDEAHEIATASGIYYLDLLAAEMNGDTVAIQVKSTSVGALTQVLVLYPAQDNSLRVNVVDIAGAASQGAAGYVGTDQAKIANPTTTVDLSGTTIKNVDNPVARVTLTDTVTTYTGNTPQTGDSYARIGAAGAGLTALGDTRIANLDATVSSRLAPTVAARTLDVSTGGEAGVDWANVGSPTTALDLSGTTIKNVDNAIATVTTVTNDVGITQAGADKVWMSATRSLTAFGFTVAANLTQILGTVLTETVLGNLANAFKKWFNVAAPTSTMNEVTLVDTTTAVSDDVGITQTGADKVWGSVTRSLTDKVGFALSTGGVQAIWDALTSALTTPGSIGKFIVDSANGSAAAVWNYLVSALGAVTTVGGYFKSLLDTINAQVHSGTLTITSGFDSAGNLYLTRYETYNASLNTRLLLTVSVPTDPTGATVTWTFKVNENLYTLLGVFVSYNALATTAVFGLDLTSAQSGALGAGGSQGNFTLSAVLGGTNVLQSVPYTRGNVFIAQAANPLP